MRSTRVRLQALGALVALLVAAVTSAAPASRSVDFTLPMQVGEQAAGHFRLGEERGRVVWLALVAPWCGECGRFATEAKARLTTATDSALGALPQQVLAISAVDRTGRPLQVDDVPVLVDRRGDVLERLAPPELPWLVRIDENGVPTLAGGDLDALAPVEAESAGWFADWGSLGSWFGEASEANEENTR